MGVKHLAGRPFTAGRVDSTAPGPQSQKFCGFRRVLPIGDYPCLLKLQHWSHRGAGGALPGALVGSPVLLDADPEVLGQLVGVAVGERSVGTLDAAQRGGRNLHRSSKFGLGESLDHAPVSGVALAGRDGDDLLDRRFEDAHHPGQQIHLGRALAGLPVEDRSVGDVSQTGQVADTDALLPASLGKSSRVESAQHTTSHARSAPRFIVEQIHRGLPKSVNVGVLHYRLRLEYGVSRHGAMRRDSVKLPRVLTQRPSPRMPELVGFEPRFDAIPTPRVHQPAEVVRPLYWWAKGLRANGDVLVDARFDAATMAATVTVRLASYQVVEVVRRHDDKPRLPHDLAALIAEARLAAGLAGLDRRTRGDDRSAADARPDGDAGGREAQYPPHPRMGAAA